MWYWDSSRAAFQGEIEREVARKAAAHAKTKTVSHFDTLGRMFLTVEDNGDDGEYNAAVEFDIKGNQTRCHRCDGTYSDAI